MSVHTTGQGTSTPTCREIRIFAFRGDRTPNYWAMLQQKIDAEEQGGQGPTNEEVLLYAGHAGVSFGDDLSIYGFNPQPPSGMTVRHLLSLLKAGAALPGVVRNDTAIFPAARTHGLNVEETKLQLPPQGYNEAEARLASERKASHYNYGFPNGDGDCNCATWIERIALPLLTGRMDELTDVMHASIHYYGLQRRRFGKCR